MKAADFLSERMIFGVLIIGGSIALLFEIVIVGPHLPPEIVTLASLGLGGLITSLGTIVAAIWKTDKTDKQVADTAAVLAAKAPDLSGTGSGGGGAPVTVVNSAVDPVQVQTAGASTPFMERPIR